MVRGIQTFLQFLIICLTLGSCSSLPADPGAEKFIGREMWTATNLRLYKGRIYWQNYLNAQVLPVGTYIRFLEINVQTATFLDRENREYTFYWQRQGETHQNYFEKEAAKYFTFIDPKRELENLGEEERKTIEIGELKEGMSKRLVLLSCGYPPLGDPMLHDTWIYWLNEQKKCAVQFEEGIVVQIIYGN